MVASSDGRKTCGKNQQQDSSSLSDVQPLDCSTNKPSVTPSSSASNGPDSGARCTPVDQQETQDDARVEVRLRPNLRIRRLWAPHQGRLRIPNPPKLIANWYVSLTFPHLN